MNFKDFLIKNKKFLIAGVISGVVGIGFGSSMNQTSLNNYITKNQTVLSQISEIEGKGTTGQDELVKLQEQKTFLENEKKSVEEGIRVAKEEAERKAKEEQERLAKEEEARKAKEEADRIAKEEAEKKKQDAIAKADADKKAQANSNNSNGNSKPSGGNTTSAASNGGGSNQATEPVGEMVWKTKSGKKYHSNNSCGNTDSSKAIKVTIKNAKAAGLTPCSKCY